MREFLGWIDSTVVRRHGVPYVLAATPSFILPAARIAAFFGLFLSLSVHLLTASAVEERAVAEPAILGEAMSEVPDSRLNRVLQRHFNDAMGGEDVWRRVVSLRIDGRIVTPQGSFELRAYQKRPNLLKMTLKRQAVEIALGYDGEIAWKVEPPGDMEDAVPMEGAEARKFIHNANFDSYLLYPLSSGKTLEYEGLVEGREDEPQHLIRVSLDDGFVLDYHLDLRSFLIRRVVTRDILDNVVNTIEYYDYTRVLGMPIAQRIVNSEGGSFTSEFLVDRVTPNLGLARWMFRFPGKEAAPR